MKKIFDLAIDPGAEECFSYDDYHESSVSNE